MTRRLAALLAAIAALPTTAQTLPPPPGIPPPPKPPAPLSDPARQAAFVAAKDRFQTTAETAAQGLAAARRAIADARRSGDPADWRAARTAALTLLDQRSANHHALDALAGLHYLVRTDPRATAADRGTVEARSPPPERMVRRHPVERRGSPARRDDRPRTVKRAPSGLQRLAASSPRARPGVQLLRLDLNQEEAGPRLKAGVTGSMAPTLLRAA